MTLEIKTDQSMYRMFDVVHGSLYYGIEEYAELNGTTIILSDDLGGPTGLGSNITEIPLTIRNDSPQEIPIDTSLWTSAYSAPSVTTLEDREAIQCSRDPLRANTTSLTGLPLDCSHDWVLTFKIWNNQSHYHMEWGFVNEEDMSEYIIGYLNEDGWILAEYPDSDRLNSLSGANLAINQWTNVTVTCYQGEITIEYTNRYGNDISWTTERSGVMYLTGHSWGSSGVLAFADIQLQEYKTSFNIQLEEDSVGAHQLSSPNFTESRFSVVDDRIPLNIYRPVYSIQYNLRETDDESINRLKNQIILRDPEENIITNVTLHLGVSYQGSAAPVIVDIPATGEGWDNLEENCLTRRGNVSLSISLRDRNYKLTEDVLPVRVVGVFPSISLERTSPSDSTIYAGEAISLSSTVSTDQQEVTFKIIEVTTNEIVNTTTITGNVVNEVNTATFKLPSGLETGTYTVSVVVNGTDTYESGTRTFNSFLVISPKINTHFLIQRTNEIRYNGSQFKTWIILHLLDENNNPVDAPISSTVDNNEPELLHTLNGVVTWDIVVNTIGFHYCRIQYEGDRRYNGCPIDPQPIVLSIKKLSSEITSADIHGYSTRNCNIDLKLTGSYLPFDSDTLQTVNLTNKTIEVYELQEHFVKVGETTTDNQGNANYIFNSAVVGTHRLRFRFPGDELYDVFTKDIYVTLHARTAPTITTQIEDNIYGYTMKVHVTIRNTQNTPLNNELIELYDENNTLIGSSRTNNDGGITFNFPVNKVGNFNWRVRYPETDPYTEVNLTLPVELLKDTPILSMITDKNIYTDGHDGLLTMILQDSQGRALQGNIKLTNHENEKISLIETNSNGIATYTIDAYAGLRQFNAIYPETTYYNTCSNYVIVNYDINQTFRVQFRNGKAILPIDNLVIPLGLYDVDMDYLGFNDYGASFNNQGIDVKKATYFRILSPTTPISSEAMNPVELVVQLYDRDGNNLVDKNVTSKINNTLSLSLVTDNDGCVTRVYPEIPSTVNEKKTLALRAQSKVGSTDIFTFRYGHTLKLASCMLEVPVTWTRITPTLDLVIPEVIYADVPVELGAELYYTRFNQKIPIVNQKITFKDNSNKTLFSVTTDSTGKASKTYINSEIVNIVGTAGTSRTDVYNGVSTAFELNVIGRVTPELIVHDITAEYNIPCNLLATLNDEEGNPLSGYKIQFKQDSMLLCEGTTNNSGYVMIPYTPKQVGTQNIQAIFTRPNQNCKYNSTTQTFTLTVEKATPTLEFTITPNNTNTFQYGTPLTLNIKLKHNTQLIPTNNYIAIKETTQQNTTTATTILTQRLNNGEITTTINNIRPNDDTINLFVRYGETTNYNNADSEFININITKLDTYLVPLQQETYKKTVTQQYNNIEYNTQLTTYATLFYKNYLGEILPVKNTQIIAVHEATEGGAYLGTGSGKHTLISNTNTDGIAKFQPVMLYKEGTIYYTVKFEGSNILKTPTITPQWKINIIKGTIQLMLEDISPQAVYAGLKKINPSDQVGIQLELTAKNNNNQNITTLPVGANPLRVVVDSGFLYDQNGDNPQVEVFTINEFPSTFYVSSGSIWNTNDQGIRDVRLHLYSHNLYKGTDSNIAQVTLLERDTTLTYKLYNKQTNTELPVITNEYGTGYSVTLPEQIYIKGTLKYKLVPGDINYAPNTMKGVTGENYTRALLTQCENIYQQSEQRAENDPNFDAQSWLAQQMQSLGVTDPINLIRIGMIGITGNTETDTGYQLAIVNGDFSSNDSTSGFEWNASLHGGETNVSRHTFIEVLYRNAQNFLIKGVKDRIELFVKKASVEITFNASATSVSSGSSVTFSGKVTWKDSKNTPHDMGACNANGLGLCIFINNTSKEVNINSDGTYSYNYTHNGSSYTAKMFFRGALVNGENYYEPTYSSTKNITIR